MVADIRSICQITLNKVNSIVEHSVDTSDDVIKECLPLKTIDGLLNLEDLLDNNKLAASQFMNKLVLVGGSDYKNLIRRCLEQIDDEDELAQYCSWTGQKRNFKISDSKTMDILKPSVKTVFNATTDRVEQTHCDGLDEIRQTEAKEEGVMTEAKEKGVVTETEEEGVVKRLNISFP
ncbi:hypothetical protein JTB14_014944 [Gonioctena quinquepunctata]|nr:hypothetical protein JTB14_014944 [Gonioctena quinquepunctata]